MEGQGLHNISSSYGYRSMNIYNESYKDIDAKK